MRPQRSRGRDQPVGRFQIRRDGLLHQHVDAVLQQPAADLRVGRSGRGDDGRVDLAGQFPVIGDGGAGGIDIHHRGQLRARGLPDHAAVVLPELSRANYRDSYASGACPTTAIPASSARASISSRSSSSVRPASTARQSSRFRASRRWCRARPPAHRTANASGDSTPSPASAGCRSPGWPHAAAWRRCLPWLPAPRRPARRWPRFGPRRSPPARRPLSGHTRCRASSRASGLRRVMTPAIGQQRLSAARWNREAECPHRPAPSPPRRSALGIFRRQRGQQFDQPPVRPDGGEDLGVLHLPAIITSPMPSSLQDLDQRLSSPSEIQCIARPGFHFRRGFLLNGHAPPLRVPGGARFRAPARKRRCRRSDRISSSAARHHLITPRFGCRR